MNSRLPVSVPPASPGPGLPEDQAALNKPAVVETASKQAKGTPAKAATGAGSGGKAAGGAGNKASTVAKPGAAAKPAAAAKH